MSRYRLYPTPAQQDALLGHCAQARYVWNLAVEQRSWWQPGHPAPGYAEQCRQLSEARAANPWLAAGSVIVQQQALRDFHAAYASWFAALRGWRQRCAKTPPDQRPAPPSPPSWRKRGRREGFRIVAVRPQDVQRLNRRWGQVLVPKLAGSGSAGPARCPPPGPTASPGTTPAAGMWRLRRSRPPSPRPPTARWWGSTGA